MGDYYSQNGEKCESLYGGSVEGPKKEADLFGEVVVVKAEGAPATVALRVAHFYQDHSREFFQYLSALRIDSLTPVELARVVIGDLSGDFWSGNGGRRF
jgi:hypothetical protein